MNKPVKPILFAIIVLAATASAFYVLNMLDQIVHGQLYNYELRFDPAWANPYWNLLRIIQILLGVVAAATIANTVFTVWKYNSTKKPSAKMMPTQKPVIVSQPQARLVSPQTRTVPPAMSATERASTTLVSPSLPPALHVTPAPSVPSTSAPPTTSPPAPNQFSAEIPGLIRCSHCSKAFTQPLRMLDFQGDRPRIVSICPFCNEIINATPRQEQEESEKDKKFPFRRKNNNHTSKTVVSQSTN